MYIFTTIAVESFGALGDEGSNPPTLLPVHIHQSQAPRQGLAVLMTSAVVVLKHETSTVRQRHNFISIDFKFGVGDYVREVTSPAKFGSGPMSGRAATWGQHIRVL